MGESQGGGTGFGRLAGKVEEVSTYASMKNKRLYVDGRIIGSYDSKEM